MKRIFCFIVFSLICEALFAQYTETITTSRPGQAFTPLSVGKNVFQVQTGMNINGARFDLIDDKINGAVYSALFRYGVMKRVEFRTQFGVTRIKVKPSDQELGGLSSFALGTKINLLNGEGNKPKIGIQADFFLPAVDDDFQADNIGTSIVLAHTQGLNEDLALSTNFGVFWDGNGSDPVGSYVLNLGFPVSGDLSSFIEIYGFYSSNSFDVLLDGGFAYALNDDLLVDLSAGYGSNDGIKQFFVDFGVSWRTRFGS